MIFKSLDIDIVRGKSSSASFFDCVYIYIYIYIGLAKEKVGGLKRDLILKLN